MGSTEASTSTLSKLFASVSLHALLPAVLVLLAGWIAAKILIHLFERVITRTRLNKSLIPMLTTMFRSTLYALVVLAAAGTLGIDLSGLVAVVSVLTLAVSLAVQGALSNVAGGVQILSAHPFQIGDFVEISGLSGTVEETGLVYTTIATSDGKRVFFPNSDVATSTIINYSSEGKRRVELTFNASYDAPADVVLAALRQAAACELLLDGTEIFVAVSKYADSSIEYLLRVWCKSQDYQTVYFGILDRVRQCFEQANIEMTYPHLNVHIANP